MLDSIDWDQTKGTIEKKKQITTCKTNIHSNIKSSDIKLGLVFRFVKGRRKLGEEHLVKHYSCYQAYRLYNMCLLWAKQFHEL